MDFLLSQNKNKNKNKTIIFDDTCLIASFETQFLAHTRLVHFLLTLSFQTHPKQTKNPNQRSKRCQSPFSLNLRQLFSAVSLEKRSSSKTIRFGYNPLDFLLNQNRSRPYEFEFAFSATRPQNFFYKRELVQYIDRDLIDTQLASPEKVSNCTPLSLYFSLFSPGEGQLL